MPPEIVGLSFESKPMDRQKNPLSKPHLVKLRRRGGSVSRGPKPPLSGYNPFSPESESDQLHDRVQSWRPFDSGVAFSGPDSRESSPQDPPITPVFGFSSSTNAVKHTNEGDDVGFKSFNGHSRSNVYKGTAQTVSGLFTFGNSTQKAADNSNWKDGKENKPAFVFGASENMLDPSSLPEKVQTWHPFHSGTESKGNLTQDGGAFVFGTQEKIQAENGTFKVNGSSDFDKNFIFGGSTSVQEDKDSTVNVDSVREKLEKGVHISSSFVPEEKVGHVIGKFPVDYSYHATNEEETAGSFDPGSDNQGPASVLPEEMKKLNLQNSKNFDDTKIKNADVLPEKVERLNLESGSGNLETEPPEFIFGTKVNESTGSRQTSSESTYLEQFVFGSSANTFSDNMKNFNTTKERDGYTPGAFSFNFQDWETEPKVPETTLPDAMKKSEIGSRKKAGLRDKKGKKNLTRLGKHKTAQAHVPFFTPGYRASANSSKREEQVPLTEPELGSPAGYSPMDCSPYRENYASDDTHRSISLEAETEIELASAAEQLKIKEENLNENKKSSSKKVDNKEMEGGGDGMSVSGINLNLDDFKSGPPPMAFNVGSKEDAAESMDYMGTSSVNVGTENTVSGSSFRFTASTSAQCPVPTIRRHFRRKNRVVRGSVESNTDQGTSSSVQSGSQWTNASISETKKETTGTSGPTRTTNSGAMEACEKWRMRGNQAYADGRLQKAEEYYTRGINSVTSEDRSGSCARALMLCYSNRAATRMSLGRMREAFVDCLIALEADPEFLRARVRAANCLIALGEVDEAMKYYNQCIQSDGVDSKIWAEAREGLGKIEKFSQYVDQATQLLQKGTSAEVARVLELISDAMLIGTNSDGLTEMKAKALLLLHRHEEVVQLCEQSSELAEKNSNFGRSGARDPRIWRWVLLSKSYFYLGKLEEALQVLKKYEEVKPIDERSSEIYPSPAVIGELLRLKASGNEAFQAGRYAEAIESYTSALTYNGSSRPFTAICFGNRAAAYQAQGQIMDAIADCSLAISVDPNYAKAISRRATLYETIRDYGQAANDLRRLIILLEKQSQPSSRGKSSKGNTELHRASARLSSMEDEARRRNPLNMYLILGIEQTSSAADIKKAYRKAALRHHPDKAAQYLVRSETVDDTLWNEIVQEVHKDADHLFKIIGEAYNVLSDETKRLKYDVDEEVRSGRRGHYNEYEEYTKRYHERSDSRHSWKSRHHWSDDYYW